MMRFRPVVSVSKEQALKNRQIAKQRITKAATAVMGGVKAVGRVAVKPIKWAGKQIEKEWRGEDAEIEDFRKKQKAKGNI